MKRLLTLLIAIITLVSCDEFINSIAPKDYINVEPTNELHFLSSESSIVLTVDSSGEWMVEGITEWCSVTPESGVNGDELTISVTENTLDEERTAELTLRCGVAEIIISVVQEKMVETDYVDMDFDSEGTATQYNASTGIVSITYSNGNIPNVEVGKAIVLPADYKFDIRVVESVSKSDNTLTLETSQGSMCNLFRNTSFTLSTNENTRSVDANGQPIITPVAIGYYDANGKYIETYNQLKPSTLSTHTISTALWSFNMNWNGATLYEGKGGRLWWEKCAFDAGLNGVFNFDFGEQPGGILGKVGEIEEFSYTLQGSIGADLLMHYRYEKSAKFSDDRILEYNVIPTKVYKFVVNGVYVYILVNTHLGQYVEFGAEGYVDISGGVKLGLDVEAGLKWSKAYGVEVIKSATPHMDIHHPTIKAEASAYAKFSYYPQVEIGLYGFIGPFVEPRPYVKENVSAGFRASTDGENYVAFKDEYFSGLDMSMGLKLDFGLLDWEWKSNVFNVVDDTLLVTSPSRITQTSPSSSNVKIEEGESINATFKVESYSPVTGKYWPCEGAAVVFESESGELSQSVALTDASGIARITWSPTKSTRATTKSHTLKARIYDIDGNVIDEVQLIAEVEEENIDREILIKFYHDTGGENWDNNYNWCTDAPLEDWYGVYCNEDGRVTRLDFGWHNNLTGCGTLSGCTALEHLHCENNNLTSLDVSGCTALVCLDCSDNNLTSLDVSGCTALEYLCCGYNNLTSLDVSGFTALEDLYCGYNNLTSLDVSGCTALEDLQCYNNNLTSLDVSGCTALEWLDCRNNKISQVITEFYDNLNAFNYDRRYEYWGWSGYTDRGFGWWYPGEPEKGYHGR